MCDLQPDRDSDGSQESEARAARPERRWSHDSGKSNHQNVPMELATPPEPPERRPNPGNEPGEPPQAKYIPPPSQDRPAMAQGPSIK